MSSLPHFLAPEDPLYLSSDEHELIDHVSDSEEEEPATGPWAPPTGYTITKEDWDGGMEVMDTITDLVYAQEGLKWILVTIPITLPNFQDDAISEIAMNMYANRSQEIEDLPPAGYAFFANKVIEEWDTELPTWYLLNVNDIQYWKIYADDYGYYYQNIATEELTRDLPVLVEDTDTKIYNHLLIQHQIQDLLVGNSDVENSDVENSDEDLEDLPSLLIAEAIRLAETLTVDPPDNDFKIKDKQEKRNEKGRRLFNLIPRNMQKEWLKRHGVVNISTYDFSDNSDSDDSNYDPNASYDSSSDEDSDGEDEELANRLFQGLSSSLFSVGEFVTFKDGWDVGLTDPADVYNSGFVQSMGSENWEIMDIGNYVENPYAVIPIIIYDYQLKKQFVGINDEIEDQTLIFIHEKYLEKTTDLSLKQHKSEITMARQRRKASLAQLAQDAQVKEKAKQHKKRQIQRRRQRKKAQQIALEQANKQASAFASLLAAPGISSLAMTGTMPSTSFTGMRI